MASPGHAIHMYHYTLLFATHCPPFSCLIIYAPQSISEETISLEIAYDPVPSHFTCLLIM